MNDLNKPTREEMLQTIMAHLPDSIYVKDLQARKIFANPANYKRLGCQTEAEILGKTDFDFFSHDIASAYYFDDQAVLQGQPIINREEQTELPNGEARWTLTSKIPWQDAEGNIIGLIGVGRDITDQVQAQIKLQEERDVFFGLWNCLTDCVYAADVEGRIVRINPAGLQLLGLKAEAEAIGKTLPDLFPNATVAKMTMEHQPVLQAGTTLINQEGNLLLADGKTRRIILTKMPWRSHSGKIQGIICIIRDREPA